MKLYVISKSGRKPQYKTAGAAGFDIQAFLEAPMCLPPGGRALVPTGLFLQVPEGYEAQVRARSGLAIHYGIGLVNGFGTVDADYRGEYIVPLYNDSGEPRTVENGERIAQMVLLPCRTLTFELSGELGDTDRGAAGFGSTGK